MCMQRTYLRYLFYNVHLIYIEQTADNCNFASSVVALGNLEKRSLSFAF